MTRRPRRIRTGRGSGELTAQQETLLLGVQPGGMIPSPLARSAMQLRAKVMASLIDRNLAHSMLHWCEMEEIDRQGYMILAALMRSNKRGAK